MLVLMAGLPGTGKSTLARALAQRTGGAVLGKDEIRSALFSAADIEYSTAQDDFVMDAMLDTAGHLLQKNSARVIFLDGRTFSRRYQIERVLAFADRLSQPHRILECTCSEASARRRLELERDLSHPAGNRTFALYQQVRTRFEPIQRDKLTLDTDCPLDECVAQALAYLLA